MEEQESFLDQLYDDKVKVSDPKYDLTPEALSAQEEVVKLEAQLLSLLSPEARRLYEDRMAAQMDLDDLLRRQFFKRAFRMGASCMRDMLQSEADQTEPQTE